MQKLEFYTLVNDTGSSYNSFTGHYSSLDKLLECLGKSEDFKSSMINQARNNVLYMKNVKLLNKVEDFDLTFEIQKTDDQIELKVLIGNISLSHGHDVKHPEIKLEGFPYVPESSEYVETSRDIINQTFTFQIIQDFILLDVIHHNYGKITTLDGMVIEE